MTLAGYRRDRPMVLGQHTPISLARERDLWKRIPFLKDNEGMLPPYMIVVGDRRRVLSAAMPLADHIMLHKEVAHSEWCEDSRFKANIGRVLAELRGIRLLAQSAGLFFEPIRMEHMCLAAPSETEHMPAAAALLSVQDTVVRRWYHEMEQLISELEWLSGSGGKPEFFSHSRLSAAVSGLITDATFEIGEGNERYSRVTRRLRSLADFINADAGRVNLAIGVFEYNGKPLPLTILETQMGCSAQDINAWEALVNSREDGYMLGRTEVPAQGLVAIRAGTCGGIIVPDGKGGQLEEPFIGIGDVVNATYSFADGATVRQRMGAWSSLDAADISSFRESWDARTNSLGGGQNQRAAGNGGGAGAAAFLKAGPVQQNRTTSNRMNARFSKDLAWPIVHSSADVIAALSESARGLGLACHEGGNFTKESLYLESDEERVKDLRRKYGALSTEMEHFGLAHLTNELSWAGIPAQNGLISTVVGTVPGGSFAMPGSREEEKANESQGKMLEAAMRALWKIAYGG